jgi:hypothetical protein
MKNSKALKWIGIVVGAFVLIGIGAAAGGTTDPTTTTEYKAVAAERDEAKADLTTAQADLSAAQAEVESIAGDLPDREAAVKAANIQLDQREADVKAAEQAARATEKALHKREVAVGIVEKEIAANTITDGTYEVGVDIKAGTYKTKGASGCYYSVNGDANGNDIISNNISDGPGIVSVSNGQWLELDCSNADWVLQH